MKSKYKIISYNGAKYWYLNGKLHREDGPAADCNGHKYWYQNNTFHREDGPAVELNNGNKEWWINGKLHRENGPAIEYPDGEYVWYYNGRRHRLDGPAVKMIVNSKIVNLWYVNGIYFLTEKDFKKYLLKQIYG